ncbi:hypothetical protein [Actinomadura sp. 7K534]|uniref:hypothetical protein n=1 Tax=Actinomadura sp. 7K534 TaxID=2530366 RepID=UPI00104B9D66|nr:hypothetical protein [Actinomadura sp. 7K534]TDB99253.1 hypothetical protein E1266_00210 [Actinomadura sp. 7K534]
MRYTIRRPLAAVAAAALTMGGTSGLVAGSAQAGDAIQISQWASWGQPCGTYLCLYYSPGLWNASWRPAHYVDKDLSGNKFYDSGYFGSAGKGQVVNDNAASAGNRSTNCLLIIWRDKNLMGYGNFLHPGWSGDFIEHSPAVYHLRNAGSSVDMLTCN